jgi:uracil-DNA glycosylase
VEAAGRGRPLGTLVAELAAARIGDTYNQYCRSRLRRGRLAAYLASKHSASIVLVGEAAGYRGARVSGIPFTSERQLTGSGPAEASATIVQRVLAELGLEDDVLLWNVVPTHPHEPDRPYTNRRPTRAEVEASSPFLEGVARGRRLIAIGRLAQEVTGAPYVRHPSHGGAAAFRAGLQAATISPRRALVRPYFVCRKRSI